MTAATELIWKEHANQLRGFIYTRVPDASLVDDVLQEVFLKVQSKITSLKNETRLQSWLYQIARNTIIDHFRARKPEEELPEAFDLPAAEQPKALEKLAGCLKPMLDALPAKYRDTLVLSELEGLPQKQVAERLGISLSAVKSRVQRARHQLKEVFTECCLLELDHRGSVMSYQPKGDRCRRC